MATMTKAYCVTCNKLIYGPVQLSDHQDQAPLCDRCKDAEAKTEPVYNLPYPMCVGNPTKADCHNVGYCRRDRACDD